MASPLLVPILVRASSLSRCLVFSNSKLQPVPILVCASVFKFEVAGACFFSLAVWCSWCSQIRSCSAHSFAAPILMCASSVLKFEVAACPFSCVLLFSLRGVLKFKVASSLMFLLF
ncbi:hypothetical protein EDD22DRAFT_227740 [Suillus occidentalis]|nr:hypothetical protein EDD22DRAFT_227740 [Suillus occidentalis]